MIARLLIALGLVVLLADCIDFTITGLALIAALIIALGWLLNQKLGRARRRPATGGAR